MEKLGSGLACKIESKEFVSSFVRPRPDAYWLFLEPMGWPSYRVTGAVLIVPVGCGFRSSVMSSGSRGWVS